MEGVPRRTIRYKPRFDSQVNFQLYKFEKQLIIDLVQGRAQIEGRRFGCMGDVLRDMLNEYFVNHGLIEVQENE